MPFVCRFLFGIVLASSGITCAEAANTRCMIDKAQKIARIVALDDKSAKELGWEGPSGVSAFAPQIAPVARDNGNRNPGHFRIAYFEIGYTTAYYTSYADPSQANIKFIDRNPKGCGAAE